LSLKSSTINPLLMPMKSAPTGFFPMPGFARLNGRHWKITRAAVLIAGACG